MLKKRIMPTLLYKDTTLVKGISFDSWRRVGSLMQAIKVYNLREVDELVFLDITASLQHRHPDFHLVDDFADECFMPLTVGGGISTVNDVRKLLGVGADKVSLNTTAFKKPSILSDIADRFGSQCVVVSIDYKADEFGNKYVHILAGREKTNMHPVEFAILAEKMGAGEILLTSIDRDGTMTGYDYETTAAVAGAVSIPVIASGGAGDYSHMEIVLSECQASAVAAASIFHFTEYTPLEAKQYLHTKGISTRL